MRAALEKIDGVKEVKADHTKREVRAKYLPAKVKVEAMLQALKDSGFEGKLVKTEPAT